MAKPRKKWWQKIILRGPRGHRGPPGPPGGGVFSEDITQAVLNLGKRVKELESRLDALEFKQ